MGIFAIHVVEGFSVTDDVDEPGRLCWVLHSWRTIDLRVVECREQSTSSETVIILQVGVLECPFINAQAFYRMSHPFYSTRLTPHH